jgi:hypothetical protein
LVGVAVGVAGVAVGAAALGVFFPFFFLWETGCVGAVVPVVAFVASDFGVSAALGAGVVAAGAGAVPWAYAVAANTLTRSAVRSLLMEFILKW